MFRYRSLCCLNDFVLLCSVVIKVLYGFYNSVFVNNAVLFPGKPQVVHKKFRPKFPSITPVACLSWIVRVGEDKYEDE